MGGHGLKVPNVPDYRIYKVENHPNLVKTQNMLAQHGLKDPWLRNECWRYGNTLSNNPKFEVWKAVYFRRAGWGLGLTILTILGEKTYHYFYPEEKLPHH